MCHLGCKAHVAPQDVVWLLAGDTSTTRSATDTCLMRTSKSMAFKFGLLRLNNHPFAASRCLHASVYIIRLGRHKLIYTQDFV
jgi:hypothetical protein